LTDNQRIAIDRLNEYSDAKKDIRLVHQRIQEIESRCNKLTRSCDSIMHDSGRRDKDGNKIFVPLVVQHGKSNSREGLIDTLIDTKSHYWQKCVDAEKLCREIELTIFDYCPGVFGRILSSYYLYNLTFEKISVMESYSYEHIRRLHWQALEQYGSKMSYNVYPDVVK
jgi:hypothetical protein